MRGPVAGMSHERRLKARGFRLIAGVDEVGRKPGGSGGGRGGHPRFRPAVRGLRDSKLLTAAQREVLGRRILERALAVGIGGGGG